MSKGKGRLVVLSGPSGTGKGTVLARLMELHPGFVFSVSATTRAPRAGEVDGVSYHFVSRDRFDEMIRQDEFLEYAEYVGEYYGTPVSPISAYTDEGRYVLLDIEVLGAKQVMAKVPDAVTIFIVPPDMAELERRLRGRGTDSEEKIRARLVKAQAELEEKAHFDHVVVNDQVQRVTEEILKIINNCS